MDLASLQVSIKETGAENAIKKLDSLRESARKLNLAINTLNKKTGKGGAFYKGIESIGKVAAIASTSVKTLKDQLNSIGANKLSDLINASNKLSVAGNRAAKGIAAVKIGLEKAAQEASKTALAEEKVTTEKERQRRIATQTLAIERQSNQAIQNSVLLTESKASRQNALSVMETLRGKQKLAIGDVSAIKANAVAEERLKVATNNTTTSIIRQEAALKNQESATARATLAQNRLSRQHETSNYHLKKHTQSWLQHWRSVATGIVLYQGIRSGLSLVVKGFKEGIAAVDDFQVSAIQLAAILTTMAKEGDPIANFQEASRYAEALIPVLQKIDIRTSLNLQNLKDITLEMAKQGVVLDATNDKQVEGFTRISNAVALYSRNGQDTRQLQQEVRAMLQGQTRDTDQLGKLLKSILGDSLKPTLKIWKEEGVVIEKIGELLKGFGPANDKMANTWSAVKASSKTVFDIISREALTPVLAEWVELLGQFNAYLIENKERIAEAIQYGWEDLKTATKTIADNLWVAQTAMIAFVSYKTITGAIALAGALNKIASAATLAAGGLASLEAVTGTGVFLSSAVGAVGLLTAQTVGFTLAIGAAGAAAYKAGEKIGEYIYKQSGLKLQTLGGGMSQGEANREYERLKAEGILSRDGKSCKVDLTPKGSDTGKLGFETNSPAGDEDQKAHIKAQNALIAYNNARSRTETLLDSLIDKESQYETIKDKSAKSLREVEKLELLNQKYKAQGIVISENEIETAKRLIAENEKLALVKASGGSKAIKQQLEVDLEEQKKFYDAGILLRYEYEDKQVQLKSEASRKLIALDNSTMGIMKQATIQWSESWSSTLNDMVWGAETSFAKILESFGQMITQMIIQKQLVEPVVGGLSGMFTSSSSSAIDASYNANVGTLFADGGIMTSDGPLPLRAYASGGVANMPQVSVFGEGSMAEAYVPLPDGRSIPVTMNANQQPAQPQNIKVEIVNESNEQLQTKNAEVKQDTSGMILSIVIDGINRNKMGMRDLISAR